MGGKWCASQIINLILPWPRLHEVLPAENHHHIDAAVVEHPCPIVYHPLPGALVYEIVLEVEYVRVIGRHADVHVHHDVVGVLRWSLSILSTLGRLTMILVICI